ncbi:IS4 family transposase [Pseudanabaena biceps PCC 7429]|uniref:IS4 family transposase n=1 Tax=Pseudanabaena biceps PCC 7429 TaxID=927668 RepID=L8N0R1_9CYAN|nr:IS4 family transposase [Pseudanabaena biceps PCC 7429]
MTEKYEIRNWSEYNAGLKQRGSLTFWISEEVIEGWLNQNIKRQTGSIQRL